MEIYEVDFDVNHYRSFDPEDEGIWETDLLEFDCLPKRKTWVPPRVHCLNPQLIYGDFWDITPGTMVIAPRAMETVQTCLEMAGELLELPYKGETFSVLNVTNCVDCLDQDKTQWVYGKESGEKISIEKYEFRKQWVTESSLFKIPETSKSAIYCYEGVKDPEDEFKFNVEKYGLKGLIFNPVWKG